MKLLSSILLVLFTLNVHAYMLDDEYVGGDDHGYGDVIGYDSMFNTHGLDVSVSGSWLTVDIFTSFTGSDIGSYRGLTENGQGIGVGDLFLSSSWNPFGSAVDGYIDDNASNGTLWSYGLAVDDAYAQGGSASLYALNGSSNDDNALLAEDFLNAGVYRNGQEVAVDTASTQTSLFNSTGSWSVLSDRISFNFDIAGTGLLDEGSLAIHWAMLCGNDVIEGAVPVSVNEPGTVMLLGFGLLCLVLARRRVS